MTVNSSGQVTDRISLHPSVDTNTGYIVKVNDLVLFIHFIYPFY